MYVLNGEALKVRATLQEDLENAKKALLEAQTDVDILARTASHFKSEVGKLFPNANVQKMIMDGIMQIFDRLDMEAEKLDKYQKWVTTDFFTS